MKKILFCLFALAGQVTLYSQVRFDSFLPDLLFDANIKVGLQSENLTCINNYLSSFVDPLNGKVSKPVYTKGTSIGIDVQGACFIDKRRHWAAGLGIMYTEGSGQLNMSNYHVEFQSTDFLKQTFRQEITATQQISEKIKSSYLTIPIMLKYRHTISRNFGIAIDGGILYSLSYKAHYSTNAAFNYEAIYKYVKGQAIYDSSSVPNASQDWLITTAEYSKTDPSNVAAQFQALNKLGYNVGLGVKPTSGTSGKVTITPGSIGFTFKPSLSHQVTKNICLDYGVFYTYQSFTNGTVSGYDLISKTKVYTPMYKSVSSFIQSNYGINIGARYYFYTYTAD